MKEAPDWSVTVIYYGNVTENGVYGQEVITMRADDYDDPDEAANARLTYSIEKNVIDEATGRPIFMIEPDTGVVRTAVCCLDREETQEYSIQVVAMDGGGLKGTSVQMKCFFCSLSYVETLAKICSLDHVVSMGGGGL
ncbi:putative neural-cadherin 2 [Macrobrachium rosenbergii]|uniref:putative neural-cadherin 2 n=1 Tax=Macrobrachium rosenbergii TaxID=79674 RepID=UPI0034D79854